MELPVVWKDDSNFIVDARNGPALDALVTSLSRLQASAGAIQPQDLWGHAGAHVPYVSKHIVGIR